MNGIIPERKALQEIILGLSERIYIYILFQVYSKRFQNIFPVLETQRKPQDLGLEDPLEEGMATHCSILGWKIPMDRGAWQAIVCRVAKSRT